MHMNVLYVCTYWNWDVPYCLFYKFGVLTCWFLVVDYTCLSGQSSHHLGWNSQLSRSGHNRESWNNQAKAYWLSKTDGQGRLETAVLIWYEGCFRLGGFFLSALDLLTSLHLNFLGDFVFEVFWSKMPMVWRLKAFLFCIFILFILVFSFVLFQTFTWRYAFALPFWGDFGLPLLLVWKCQMLKRDLLTPNFCCQRTSWTSSYLSY